MSKPVNIIAFFGALRCGASTAATRFGDAAAKEGTVVYFFDLPSVNSVETWIKEYKELKTKHSNQKVLLLCDSVLDDNQANLLRKIGGRLVRIVDTNEGPAVSEDYVNDYISNNGTIVQFHEKLDRLYQRLKINDKV